MADEKTYAQRLAETQAMSTEEIHEAIRAREAAGKPCGILHRVLADRSDERAKTLGIDPPRPGRKTYSERYSETSSMSTSEIRAKIAERRAQGKEVGVLERVLSERE
ncbi:MAG: hypothetical protein ABSE91_00120 [Patescibacteria group bacterium]|jgi:hypothetical protein